MARTVVFDFDGVIHSYTSGWKGETNIPDPPVPGIQEALKEIHDAGYEVVVVSTRCKTVLGRMAIENWLDMYGMTQEVDKVCKEKPPAIAYIDDRAICFDGHPETLLKKIQNFQPWYKKPTLTPPNEPLTQADIDKMHFDRVWIDYGVDDSGERCGEEGVVLYGKLYDIDTLDGSAFEDLLLDACDGETLDRPSGDYKVYRRPPEEEANE